MHDVLAGTARDFAGILLGTDAALRPSRVHDMRRTDGGGRFLIAAMVALLWAATARAQNVESGSDESIEATSETSADEALATLLLSTTASAEAQPSEAAPTELTAPVPQAQAEVIPQPTIAPFTAAYAPPPHGSPSTPPIEFPSHLDSSLATGIVDLSIGLTLIGFGVIITDRPEQGAMLGAGFGTLAVGVPMFAVGTQRVRYPRNDEPLYALGTVLCSMGGTLSGMGLGVAAGEWVRREEYEAISRESFSVDASHGVSWGLGIAGALVGLGGAGLMIFGAHEASPQDYARRIEQRRQETAETVDSDGKVPRSIARRTAGQVLVTVGALSFTGGLISGIAQADCSGLDCAYHLLTTLPLAGQGLITTAIGIPLWVSGDARVDPTQLLSEAEANVPPTWQPALSIGAGTASMTLRF